MKSLKRYSSICILIFLTTGCLKNNKSEIQNLLPQDDYKIEIAENVEIFYSDSAVVQVKITSPLLKRYNSREETYDEFPEGLKVEFLNKRQATTSWLEADYAIRKDKDHKVYLENNVVLYNRDNDKLLTDALIWDEANEELFTSKAVKIVQPSVGDTSFGFGFKADEEFTRFEIFRNFSAIKNIDELAKDIQ